MTKDMELTHPMVGHVGYRPARWASRAEVTMRGDDEQRQIARVKLPQWPGGEVRFYQPAAAQLRAAWAEVEAAGLLGLVKTWGDVFAPRLVTTKDEQPTDQLSPHALGLAFDLNPEYHLLGQNAAAFGLPGGTRELVRLFERHGFRWGGWDRLANGGHFEVARLLAEGETLPTRAVLTVDGQHHCEVVAQREGEAYLVEAKVLMPLLGGEATVPPGRHDGPITLTAKGRTIKLDGRFQAGGHLVPLAALAELCGVVSKARPGAEVVDISHH